MPVSNRGLISGVAVSTEKESTSRGSKAFAGALDTMNIEVRKQIHINEAKVERLMGW
ncbi:MAG: hypothetical protein P8L22_05910 [Acidimicrobiales bacterium]|nr:hypothetical protein [Acidimicrobiales bacterium]